MTDEETDSAPAPILKGSHRAALAVVALFVAVQSVVMLLVVPMGAGPDEVAHLDYIEFLRHERRLPVLGEDDCGQIQHPPLPYATDALLLALFHKIGTGLSQEDLKAENWQDFMGRRTRFLPGASFSDLGFPGNSSSKATTSTRARIHSSAEWPYRALRLVSVLLGLATTCFLILALKWAFPEHPGAVTAGVAALLLLPGWAAHFSAVSNDPWLTFLSAWACYLALKARAQSRLLTTSTLLKIGVLLGLCFLTKLHAAGVGLFLAALVLGAKRESARLGGRFAGLLKLALPPLVLAGWWHVRQIMAADGLLILEHHARFEGYLLRLNAYGWMDVLEVTSRLITSFCGLVTGRSISAPFLFMLPSVGIFTLSVLGIFVATRRNQERKHEGQKNHAPAGAALASLLFLLTAILIANRHYHHIHGRYFFAALVPLMIFVVHGTTRLTRDYAAGLLTVVAAANAVFMGSTIYITVFNTFTISLEKVERGHVATYYDCGHRYFDYRRAGGSALTRGHPSLADPAQTQRLSVDNGLRYPITLPHKDRPYQIRVRYPAPLGTGGGEVPLPTGLAMYADETMLHGPVSIWPTRGEQIQPLPQEIISRGHFTLNWKNLAPNATGVAVAEIWVEEAWIQASDLRLEDRGRTLAFTLRNIDQHHEHAVDLEARLAGTPIADTRKRHNLGPGDVRNIRIPLGEDVEPQAVELLVAQESRSPLADIKLSFYRGAETVMARSAGIPDLMGVMPPAAGPVARIPVDGWPRGQWTPTITYSSSGDEAEIPDNSLRLTCGQKTVSSWTKETGKSAITAKRPFMPAAGVPLLEVHGAWPNGAPKPILDRLVIQCPDPGFVYKLAP